MAAFRLLDLPLELLRLVLLNLGELLGMKKTLQLRLVSKHWSGEILHAAFSISQAKLQELSIASLYRCPREFFILLLCKQSRAKSRFPATIFETIRSMAEFLVREGSCSRMNLPNEDFVYPLCTLATLVTDRYYLATAIFDHGQRYNNDYDEEDDHDEEDDYDEEDDHDEELQSSLAAAASIGDLALVEKLLTAGALPDDESELFGSPLQAAASKGHRDVMDLLFQHDSGQSFEDFPADIISAAVGGDQADIIKYLMQFDHCKDLNRYYIDRFLREAIDNGCAEAMLALMEISSCQSEVSEDRRWYRNLTDALRLEHLSMAEQILQHGSFNPMNLIAAFPLLNAAYTGSVRQVKLLLAAEGADTNAGPKARICYRQRRIVKSLERGLYVAAVRGHDSVVELLLDAGAKIDWAWENPKRWKRHSRLLVSGFDYRNWQYTPLFAAINSGRPGTAALLLNRGADANAQACWYRCMETCRKKADRQLYDTLVATRELSQSWHLPLPNPADFIDGGQDLSYDGGKGQQRQALRRKKARRT